VRGRPPLTADQPKRLETGSPDDVSTHSGDTEAGVARGRDAAEQGLADALRRAEERAERHARQQAAVAELGHRALRSGDLGRLCDVVAQTVADVLDADLATVYTPRDAGDLGLAAAHGLPAGVARDDEDLREPPLDAHALSSGEPRIVVDRRAPGAPPATAAERLVGACGSITVPVLGGGLHGLLVAARRAPWSPGADAVRFLQAVANVLAGAMERAEHAEEARRQALHDPLTGLPNRTLVLDRLDQALRRVSRTPGTVAVVIVDLDRFKAVNERHGVETGDAVLRAIGPRLRAAVRPADTVARLAGDAFVVVCEDVPDADFAPLVAARVVDAVRAPLTVGDQRLALTASVGVVTARDGETAGNLLRDADAAVDRAKVHGRDRFEIYDRAQRERALERLQFECDLRLATQRGELFVVHQPIVAVAAGRITGVESLVRWRHPRRGVVAPGEFIACAEETGVIAELGAWVLRTACREVAGRQHRAPLTCHVNVSPRQAADPELPAVVEEALAASGLPPDRLVLEITESSLMDAEDEPIDVLCAVRELGVRLVLDDFGTGHSSLARLRQFPIDGLKVDRSFVAPLDEMRPLDALIVAGIVELGRALGMTVVAEGVETPTQLARLRRAGCRYAQGYLFARPAPCPEVDALLARDGLLPAAA
jgi:diguanylate cyclase (GGDEF)-like protein